MAEWGKQSGWRYKPGRYKVGGRKKGQKNLVDVDIKECFLEFVEGNLPKLQEWLDEVTPKERLDFMLKFSEYFVPKIGRLEIANADGKPFELAYSDQQLSALTRTLIDVYDQRFNIDGKDPGNEPLRATAVTPLLNSGL